MDLEFNNTLSKFTACFLCYDAVNSFDCVVCMAGQLLGEC
jgi:hypothetical protein